MKDAGHKIWGSARRPLRHLAPRTRILCGISVFTVCLLAPVTSGLGLGIVAATLLIWTLLTRPPVRVAGATLVFGLLIFLPYYLLTPLIRAESLNGDWRSALTAPSTVLIRGLGAMAAATFTMTTVSMSALRQGIAGLPLPAMVKAILIQIVHQSANLLYETRRIAAAVAARGGTTGYKTALALFASLPSVWLPRVVVHAERVADAMTMRGYCQEDISLTGDDDISVRDGIAIGISLLWLVGVIFLRWMGADR